MIFERSAVITRKEKNRVVIESECFEGAHDLADVKIELIDIVAQLTDFTGAAELFMWRDVCVRCG